MNKGHVSLKTCRVWHPQPPPSPCSMSVPCKQGWRWDETSWVVHPLLSSFLPAVWCREYDNNKKKALLGWACIVSPKPPPPSPALGCVSLGSWAASRKWCLREGKYRGGGGGGTGGGSRPTHTQTPPPPQPHHHHPPKCRDDPECISLKQSGGRGLHPTVIYPHLHAWWQAISHLPPTQEEWRQRWERHKISRKRLMSSSPILFSSSLQGHWHTHAFNEKPQGKL